MNRYIKSLEELEQIARHVERDVLLGEYTTFQLGGICPGVVTCSTPEEVQAVTTCLAKQEVPFVWIGGGSNILVSDEGYDGVVVRYVVEEGGMDLEDDEITVCGGVLLDHLVEKTVANGKMGLVYASGIPGTVGGAIVGNAGAWGKQIAENLISVRCMDRGGVVRETGPESLGFGYRRSDLQGGKELILSARIRVAPGDRNDLERERAEILKTRAAKHPDWRVLPCVGSFFRNIEPSSAAGRRQAAGWFLEEAGGKALRVGGARIYEKHANIIVRDLECRATDVHALSLKMQACVKEKFDLALEREIRLLGPFDGEPAPREKSFY